MCSFVFVSVRACLCASIHEDRVQLLFRLELVDEQLLRVTRVTRVIRVIHWDEEERPVAYNRVQLVLVTEAYSGCSSY